MLPTHALRISIRPRDTLIHMLLSPRAKTGGDMNRTTRHGVPDPSGYVFRTAIVGALLLAVAFAGPAAAQMTRGAVSGTVRDATGALVPGATVTVTNTDTNQAKSAVTDAKGFYRV